MNDESSLVNIDVIDGPVILWNIAPAKLYEEALKYEEGSAISDDGALIISSGTHTGRSPKDKRIVEEEETKDAIWWGTHNLPMDLHVFLINFERAVDYLNTRKRIYVVDGYAGWDPRYRIKVRGICSRAYHALFMQNLLLRPSEEELQNFGEPDFTIFNSGRFPANRYTAGMTSKVSIDICFSLKSIVILGTEYAGEMKKGIFTVMNYLMPLQDVLSMHCAANMDGEGNTALFFGLSGTGKTTLSSSFNRRMIGDDEHCWTDTGIFNIEGGCYAKCYEVPPEIQRSIYFGAVLENVIYDENSRRVDYQNRSVTENTRVAYPIEHVPDAVIPGLGQHPQHVLFLTCDAFGVLPPVSKLTIEQAMYHFVSGYTAKIANTEEGIAGTTATFSACFGAAFMPLHPARYARLLEDRLKTHHSSIWLINTGWSGGGVGKGKRMALTLTRRIVKAIYSDAFKDVEFVQEPYFHLSIPQSCPGVPSEVLFPWKSWEHKEEYVQQANLLRSLFHQNEKNIADDISDGFLTGGPPH